MGKPVNLSGNIDKDKSDNIGIGETFHLYIIMIFIIVMIAMVSTWQSCKIDTLRQEIESIKNKMPVTAALRQK